MMFGPQDGILQELEMPIMEDKEQTNDELRQSFIDKTVRQKEIIGLTIPDPDLKWNEEERMISEKWTGMNFGCCKWKGGLK